MPELVVPTPAGAGRIASVINARSVALGGATEESADGVARWVADVALYERVGMHVVRRSDTWERAA